MAKKTTNGIPGLSFSWKRALGLTQLKQSGIERKIGKSVLKLILRK